MAFHTDFRLFMALQKESRRPSRKKVILLLVAAGLPLFGILFSLSSFELRFINPKTSQQTVSLVALTLFVSLLFGALTFVLMRNLIKLFAERRLGVLGSKFRTRLVVGSLLLSFIPVIVMFWFAYGLMNRSIERWFSTPVEEVQQDTALMATLLSKYATENAHSEAAAIAGLPETQQAFEGHSFSGVLDAFRNREATLQGGFAIALEDGNAEATFNAPASWLQLKPAFARAASSSNRPEGLTWNGTEYVIGSAPVGNSGEIVIAMPLPKNFAETQQQLAVSQQRYLELARERRLVRWTYMTILMGLTGLVLFASLWLTDYLSRLVTKPVVALAEATQEISRGNLDYRVEIAAADELGDLVRSFNRMSGELAATRRQIEAASQDLSAANIELEQRRRQIETILESIPTGVLSLDANRRVTHVNQALLRMLRPEKLATSSGLLGAPLENVFSSEALAELDPLMRRADRMSTTTTQMEIAVDRAKLNAAVTVATLRHNEQRTGYVLVFEDLSDLLRAQKQAAWREVARRVAHEIKNPLTPIALSSDRLLRHLDRAEAVSPDLVRGCAESISSAVDTVRNLVNEFSTLASFPTSQPRPADINSIVESSVSMFNGRLDGIRVRTMLAQDLPRVLADTDAMKRAVANLVDNAAEALQSSVLKEIEISTSLVASRDAVELSVSDSGSGVTEELKEKLFLPYFSTKKRGTGLGLAIVSRIVEEHHGSIRVEENKPVGARFVIELPLASNLSPAAAETSHA
jgi:two-component system, NtrC family, nitrogen regulation sensor histidine kinase NtrY